MNYVEKKTYLNLGDKMELDKFVVELYQDGVISQVTFDYINKNYALTKDRVINQMCMLCGWENGKHDYRCRFYTGNKDE